MPKLKRYWKAIQKKEKQEGEEEARERAARDKSFLADLISQFLQVLESIPEEGGPWACEQICVLSMHELFHHVLQGEGSSVQLCFWLISCHQQSIPSISLSCTTEYTP